MALIYIADCLVISHKPAKVIKEMGTRYSLKDGAGEPDIFLGANLEKFQLPNGRMAWSMTSRQYVKNAVKNVKDMLKEDRKVLNAKKRRGNTPLPFGYRPKLNASDLLSPQLAVHYMQLIGILRWAIELGRINITTEVSVLSQYNASPREGHLEGVYHIFHYLSKHELSCIVFDPTTIDIDESSFLNGESPHRCSTRSTMRSTIIPSMRLLRQGLSESERRIPRPT